ncbi:MAG: hypothetical protein OHK0039_25300 [Bacteroidia bacterium]
MLSTDMKHISSVWLICLLVLPLAGRAQAGMHSIFLPEQAGAQWAQVAFLADSQPDRLVAGGTGLYDFASSRLPIEQFYGYEGYLDDAAKTRILSALGTDNRLRLEVMAGGLVATRVRGIAAGLSYRQVVLTGLRFDQAHSLGLLLRGNAPYAGEALSDEHIAFRLANYHEAGVSAGIQRDGLRLGARLKGLYMPGYQALDQLSYELLTAADGSSIDLQASYDYFRSTRAGGGVALDLGAVYQIGKTWEVQAALRDIGLLWTRGEAYTHTADIRYEGIEAGNLFAGDWQNLATLFPTDSLQDLLLADPVETRRSVWLPLRAHAAVTYRPSAQHQISAALYSNGVAYSRPLVVLAYHRDLAPYLRAGIHLSAGDLNRWGWGAVLAGNIPIGNHHLGLFAEYQMGASPGIVMADQLRGMMLNGGVSFRIGDAAGQ